MNELYDRIAQTLVISQSCFVLGISAVILKLYFKDRRIRHIAFVAASYILLTVLVASRYFPSAILVPWRVALAVIAFGLGDYALIKILSFQNGKAKETS